MPTSLEVTTAAENFIADTETADAKINGPAGNVTDRHGTVTKNLQKILAELEGMGASMFDSTALGLANTSNGDLFQVKGSGEVFSFLYKNVSGVAVYQDLALPSAEALTARTDALDERLDALEVPGNVSTADLADDAVTNDKLGPMAEATIKGRALEAGTGRPQDLTPSQARAAIGLGTAATAGADDFATATQGALADTAVQPGDDVDWLAETATAKIMTAAERAKLEGIATGATANATDAELRDRATHTGVQAIGTVAGLQAVLDDKSAIGHTHTASQISDGTAAGRALLTAENAEAQRTALGLGGAAVTDPADYATAAQGALADTAVQPAALDAYATDVDLEAEAGARDLVDVVEVWRPGENLDLWSTDLTGAPESRAPLTVGTVVNNADGAALRITGSDVPSETGYLPVAPRRAMALEPDRVYEARAVVRRAVDPVDPLGHAVELRTQNLSASKTGVSNVTLADAVNLVVADGRVEIAALICRGTPPAGVAAYSPPSTARYMTPHLRIYGNGADTDMVVIQWRDVTDTVTLQSDLAAETTNRVAADGALAADLVDEAAARVAGDEALDGLIAVHAFDTDNPHGVTKSQVGLGNVDNTSDADKPVSTAQAAAIAAEAVIRAADDLIATSRLSMQEAYPQVQRDGPVRTVIAADAGGSIVAEFDSAGRLVAGVGLGLGYAPGRDGPMDGVFPLVNDDGGRVVAGVTRDGHLVARLKLRPTESGRDMPIGSEQSLVSDDAGKSIIGVRLSDGRVRLQLTEDSIPVPAAVPHTVALYDSGAGGTIMHVSGSGETAVLTEDEITEVLSTSVADGWASGLVQTADGREIKGWALSPEVALGEAVTDLWVLPIYGQSLSIGVMATSSLTHNEPDATGRAVMLDGGLRILGTSQLLADLGAKALRSRMGALAPLQERNDGTSKRTIASTFAAGLLPDLPVDTGVALFAPGIGSTQIGQRAPGTTPFRNLKLCIERACAMARLTGRVPLVPAYLCLDGESDSLYQTAASYTALKEAERRAVEAVAVGATGQADDVVCFHTQTAFRAEAVPLAQLQMALDDPTHYVCIGPKYYYPHDDTIHLTEISTARFGYEFARAARRVLLDGLTALPLHMTSAVRTGASVVCTWGGDIDGDVVIDTTTITNPGNYGIGFAEDGGAGVTVTGVTVTGSRQITVTLSATPTGTNQRILVARAPNVANAGPVNGARACFRDSSLDTCAFGGIEYPLYRWACHQEIAIS